MRPFRVVPPSLRNMWVRSRTVYSGKPNTRVSGRTRKVEYIAYENRSTQRLNNHTAIHTPRVLTASKSCYASKATLPIVCLIGLYHASLDAIQHNARSPPQVAFSFTRIDEHCAFLEYAICDRDLYEITSDEQ